jgi:Serine dehydrogenase proteinase
VQNFVTRLLAERIPEPQAAALAKALSEGRWVHNYPITVLMADRKVLTSIPRPHPCPCAKGQCEQ